MGAILLIRDPVASCADCGNKRRLWCTTLSVQSEAAMGDEAPTICTHALQLNARKGGSVHLQQVACEAIHLSTGKQAANAFSMEEKHKI
jgi:hypothetical protein